MKTKKLSMLLSQAREEAKKYKFIVCFSYCSGLAVNRVMLYPLAITNKNGVSKRW